ncbi:CDP-diacylglycerol-glycerol-3-phosphate 3-phosphatidyltransferase [Kwoniella newhampshirensis]|uniref:CDP-diacylglycerol-glycerol-3-phosphate 3-phosphatidyltransferase n=1 Tax=Kwoniella newhampshirensis TaxID=1651941 RepID=A0AAW0Z5E3_9TREE
MPTPIHARGLALTLEMPYRHTVHQLQSQIVQVRLRSRDVARQLSTLTGPSPRATNYWRDLTRPVISSGAIKLQSRRYFARERPNPTEPSSTSGKPLTNKTPTPSGTSSNAAEEEVELHESPYTIPNALTLMRILACPVLGYTIVQGDFAWATGILFVSGLTDWLDGYLARRFNSRSVLGSILDPAADKALMTTLVGTLAWSGLLPIPLAVIIFGRDLALSISAFYFRFVSLPKPRTLKRYFDPSMPSAEVKPTQISKINTLLQLVLMGVTTVSPLLTFSIAMPLQALQWTVAGTTIWSGFSYIGKAGVKILKQPGKPPV